MLQLCQARTVRPFSHSRQPVRPGLPFQAQRARLPSGTRLQATNSTESERDVASSREEQPLSSGDDDIRQAIRRQQQQPPSGPTNIVQGALEEAQLITWPKPQKALLDTLLVLFIVAGSGTLLFGCNVALAELSEWWYHR